MGDGVLQLTVEDASDYLLVPDVRKATDSDYKNVNATFGALFNRPIGPVDEEIQAIGSLVF